MMRAAPNGWYDEPRTGPPHSDRGLLTERGLAQIVARVEAIVARNGKLEGGTESRMHGKVSGY